MTKSRGTARVDPTYGVSSDIGIAIDASAEADRIFGDEPRPGRAVVSVAIVQQAAAVVLAAGTIQRSLDFGVLGGLILRHDWIVIRLTSSAMAKSLSDCRFNLNAQIVFTLFFRRTQSENNVSVI